MGQNLVEVIEAVTETGNDTSITAISILDTIPYRNFDQFQIITERGDTIVVQGTNKKEENNEKDK